MFNNPFREQAIAASANRQQLDRLLRVSAPHERIALGAVGLILVGISAWVVFGDMARAVTGDCVLLVPGPHDEAVTSAPGYPTTGDAQDRRLQATLFAAPRVAGFLQPGMSASVEVQLSDGAIHQMEGSVSAIAAGWSPVGDLVPSAATAAADPMRRIEINLPPASELDLAHGTPCRARIVHGRYSIATLLGFG
ncbi:MAG: hypothetical protein OXG30_06085 [bacterium]|nr:hypothetical protein [bacterium]MCY4134466.1 hypothetical protein [bacterium]